MTTVLKGRALLTVTLSLSTLLFSLNSCKKDDDPAPVPPAPKEVSLRADAALGSVLVDKENRTLYYFANDATTTNNCTGGCEAVWPVFNVEGLTADKLGTGLDVADFTTITTASAKKQLTYKGRPLYYYAPAVGGVNTPEAAGKNTGEAVGGIWFVAKPDYSIMLTNAQLVGLDNKTYLSDYTVGTGKTNYFTDAKGVTLYSFKNDKLNTNNYTKPDFSNNGTWPIYETDKIVVPSSLDKTLFGSITVFGKKQLTYKGWPLYYFGSDGGVMGANKGVSVPTPGVWPVVRKDVATATP